MLRRDTFPVHSLAPRSLPYLLVIILATLVNSVPAGAVDNDQPTATLPALIDQLDAQTFMARRRAARLLREAGAPSIPLIVEAVKRAEDKDRELVERAITILVDFARSPSPMTRDDAVQALRSIAAMKDREAAARATTAIKQYRDERRKFVLNRIRYLGGQVEDGSARGVPLLSIQLRTEWRGGVREMAMLEELDGIVAVVLEGTWLTDDGLQHLTASNELTQVIIGPSNVTGEGVKHLRACENLTTLRLVMLPFADEDLAGVAELRSLQSLSLMRTLVKGEDLQHLKDLDRLKRLDLSHTKIADEGLRYLKELAKIEYLDLEGTKVGGDELGTLGELRFLTTLNLKGVQFGRGAAQHLAKLRRIETLKLEDTNLKDDALAHLKGLNNLNELWLSRVAITDAAVPHLAAIPNLETIFLHGSGITKKGAEKLEETIENVEY